MCPQRAQPRRRSVIVEPLETRQLLAAQPAEFYPFGAAEGPFAVNINFQLESTPTVPAGYRADIGREFALRKNGLYYGWNDGNEDNAVTRNSPNVPDARYDDFNQFVGPDAWWAVAVPDGRYRVRLVAGDATNLDSYQKLAVEGLTIVDAAPTAATPFIEGAVEVNVTDGLLSITGAPGGRDNKVAFVEIAQVNDVQVAWADAPAARIGRVEPGVVQVGDKLYVIGGYRRSDFSVTRAADVLDFKTMTWSQLAPLPPGAAESHAGVATDGRYIYWAGGQVGGEEDFENLTATSAVWRYEIATDTWSRWVDLPAARYAPGMAYVNGGLYLSGGDDLSRSDPTSTHWAISTSSRNPRWSEMAPRPRASDHHGTAVVNGVIYSIGGEHGHGTTYNQHDDLYAYDPATNTWTTKADMPTPSSHFEGGVLVLGTKIIAMGGRTALPNYTTARVRVYDTLTDEWTVLNRLPFDRMGGAAGIYGGRIYFTNGYSRTQGISAESFWGTLSGFGA